MLFHKLEKIPNSFFDACTKAIHGFVLEVVRFVKVQAHALCMELEGHLLQNKLLQISVAAVVVIQKDTERSNVIKNNWRDGCALVF